MLNSTKSTHRSIMLKVIREIYTNRFLGQNLGFKGGTAAYFFYDLPRFSVDLDFDLIEPNEQKADRVFRQIREILTPLGDISDENAKYNTLLLELNYKKGERNLKVEVSTRLQNNIYEIKELYGLSCKVMRKDYMFARKLIALTRRNKIASRDLYDINFFLNQNWEIAPLPIEEEINTSVREYLDEVIEFIEKNFTQKNVLDGVGDLLDEKQQKDVKLKQRLIDETIFALKSRV